MGFRNLLVNLGLVVGNVAAKWDPSGVAERLLNAYDKQREKAQLRAELEALLRARFVDFRAQLADAMGELRLQLADGVRGQVEAYLSQFQASARQAARLLGDPSATTVPAVVGVDDPYQLAAFLPQRPPRFTVGDAVPGLPSWTLAEPLGGGGFGEVWKARHADDGTFAAFKFLLDPVARGRFTATEARVVKEIHQKAPTDGVVKLLQAEARQDPPWLQFEFVGGGDLSHLPGTWQALADADRVARVRAVVHQLAVTVGHFHALGVVHRDLKPSNVLLRADGSLVIADFGISKIVPAPGTQPTPTSASLATIRAYTPTYASPQQKKFAPADCRDDVYALGVLWYQLLRGDLTLERPSGDGWKRVLARLGVSDWEVALLNRCWDDEPAERPADAGALVAELDRPSLPPSPGPGASGPPVASPALPHERKPGDRAELVLPGGIKMPFVWCPPGWFMRGEHRHNEKLVHKVTLTRGFYLGVYPVTQGQWQAVMGSNPSHFATPPMWLSRVLFGPESAGDRPVETVSWVDANTFCQRLADVVNVPVRLPTEAEWEYACRTATSTSAYHTGNGNAAMNRAGWHLGNSMQRTHPVGQREPNPWGLYDMHGNVWEWCQDAYGRYAKGDQTDPVRLQPGAQCVIRGGSWRDLSFDCLATHRNRDAPGSRSHNLGLRICFNPD